MQTSVLEYLEKTAKKLPQKRAFFDLERSISFSELKEESLKLASKINTLLEGKNNPVLIYLDKDVSSVVAIFGILYSKNFYTPTDTKFPEVKLSSILNALGPKAIVTNRKYLDKVKNAAKLVDIHPIFVLIDECDDQEINLNAETILAEILDVDPVYVFFTSGSTGVPKGVIINNHNVIDYVDWASETFRISQDTVLGNQSPFYFDISTQDIFSTVKTGATMGIIPPTFFAFPIKAVEYIRDNDINFLYWVPSAFINIANLSLLDDIVLDKVETIMFGGEVMPVKQLNYWKEHLPNLKMVANVYGPTEATVNCTYYILDRDYSSSENLPLGYACGNTGLIIIDEDGNKIEKNNPGAKGELCVFGSSLSPGYWNDVEKTAEKFVDNPFAVLFHQKIYKTGDLVYFSDSGELMFAGRKDFQIKHSGYRIELGEIETAALSIPEIDTAAVIYDHEKKKIVLYFKGEIEQEKIDLALLDYLPKYMMPSIYIKIRRFPLNDNGKIDRKRLLDLYNKGDQL